MQLIIEPTDKVVTLVVDGCEMPARIWEGKTGHGIPVHCYVTRVAVPEGRPPHEYVEFQEALNETRKPSADVQGIPLRLIL